MLHLLPDDEGAPDARPNRPWVVAVIDDDVAVHEGTRFALDGYDLEGHGLEIVSAFSAAEGRRLLAERRDVAVVLLDVVMETDDAGLTLVDYVRKELRNETVRIILRTGQPGQAPERRVIVDYDINDYKAKTELTADKLFTSLTAAIRAYQQLQRLHETRRGLELIIDAAPMLFDFQSMRRLAEGVLTQVASLLNASCAGILVLREGQSRERFAVLAGSGVYHDYALAEPAKLLEDDLKTVVADAFEQRRHTFGEHRSTLYVRTASGREIVVLLEADRRLSDTDRALIELFSSRLSVAFDNVILYEQLQDAHARLEERVFERTAELLRANRMLAAQRSDLRRSNQFKSEVLGTVAHDLKNPLAVILGRTEILLDLIGTDPPALVPMRAQVDHIRTSARRLTDMVEGLIADAMSDALDITLRREAVDFAALAREVAGANKPLADDKRQTVRLDGPDQLYLCGDGERLREAMDNIVSNAIKYSPTEAVIDVSVSRDEAETVFAVRDRGPGLSPEDSGRVFGRFQRLSAKPTGGESSTGLGLSIVKRIAELHRGRATADSGGPGQGTTFAIRFPNIAVELP